MNPYIPVTISIFALAVSGASAWISHEAGLQSKATNTFTVISDFQSKFPQHSKNCFAYFAALNPDNAKSAIAGKPHTVTSKQLLEDLNSCLPGDIPPDFTVNELLPLHASNLLKEKVQRALAALDLTSSQLASTDGCELAKELQNIMQWQELGGTIEKFSEFGVDSSPELFRHIKEFRSRFNGAQGLSSICKP